MAAPTEILELVGRFERNREAYLAGRYNETQLRREFIDPMFAALGWDVTNEQGYAEAYKDVIHEDSIKIGQATKAPDYCFRIGGTRKFFLEAKKPSVDIKGDPGPAYQLRRYAWSAKLGLSILTDFEEFAVYDCRIKPSPNDKSSTARVLFMTYREYAERWDEIASIFSRESVLKGSFDKYAEKSRLKKGTATVDEAFLAEIDDWRDMLAHHIALRNPKLDGRQLNFAVQITIDRIIFLRICEDRGLERYGELLALLNGPEVYARLLGLFRKADDRYNSGLFHFSAEKGRDEAPDELTPGLTIDDKPLKDILRRLYYPDSPYEFSALPAEILGQVYEQFLGKVITLTAGHRAKVEEKPEVKKAGGVFYTPSYIVDYIVQNTVGKLVEGKTPKDVEKIKVLDPACGSGSFLLGAYQFLLDWHLKYYLANDPAAWAKKKNPPVCAVQYSKGCGGDTGQDTPTPLRGTGPLQGESLSGRLRDSAFAGYKLTGAERKRILLANIYGVDIDTQAVEVTKLSLLLKVLEGERELVLIHKERALPDLADNIKCGNSLIGTDFYKHQQMSMFDDEMHYKINAFDWEKEFAEVFKGKNPGFDAVIGNPPYIRIQTMKDTQPESVGYFGKTYAAAAKGNYDIYVVFVEKALELLNANGRMGYILPHKFFNAQYGEPLRKIIADGKNLSHVVHFGDQQVFKNATTYTCLLILDKVAKKEVDIVKVTNLFDWQTTGKAEEGKIKTATIKETEWNFVIGYGIDIIHRLQSIEAKLGNIADIFVGLQTSADDVFVIPENIKIEQEITKPFLLTGNLSAYSKPVPLVRIIFPYEIKNGKAELISSDVMQRKFPKTWEYLLSKKSELMDRERGKWKHERWFAFGRSQNLTQMDSTKLIIQVTAKRPTVLFDDIGLYMTGGGSGPFYGIRPKENNISIKYLLGILNSKLFGWIINNQSTNLRGGYIKFSKQYIENVPIRLIDFSNKSEKSLHDKLVSLVEVMLDLHQKLGAAKTPDEKTRLERQIAATDGQIDELVYELYGLTEEEIKTVNS